MRTPPTTTLMSAMLASFALAAGATSAQTANPAANSTVDQKAASTRTSPDARKASTDAQKDWQRTHRASKIIGTEVRNAQGQKIGQIRDLVMDDPASGRVSHVVVAVGGVLGVGDKLFAVPYDALQRDPGKDYAVLSQTSDLAQAFDDQHWPVAASGTWTSGGADTTRASSAAGQSSNIAPSSTTATSNGMSSSSTSSSSTASSATPSTGTASSAAGVDNPPSASISAPASTAPHAEPPAASGASGGTGSR